MFATVCLRMLQTKASNKKKKMSVETVVSVPAYRGFFVEVLNNCRVPVLNKQQSHTHTHTHQHQSWSGPDLPDQGTTGRQWSLPYSYVCLLFIVLWSSLSVWTLPASPHPSIPLSSNPSLFLSHKSLFVFSQLLSIFLLAFLPLSPTTISYSSLFPTFTFSLPPSPPLCPQSETLLLWVVGLFWAEVLTLSGLGTQSDLWLTSYSLLDTHSLHVCVYCLSVCVCVYTVCVLVWLWSSVRTMTQCTLSYLSYNASILADTSSTNLCTIFGKYYPQSTWAVLDTIGIATGKNKRNLPDIWLPLDIILSL